MKIDPICGMSVDESTPHKLTRDGETNYFCSAHCLHKFSDHDHEHHAAAAAPEPAADEKIVYTCPMHPEVEQDHPGDCPKCGMALEPKTISRDTPEDDSE